MSLFGPNPDKRIEQMAYAVEQANRSGVPGPWDLQVDIEHKRLLGHRLEFMGARVLLTQGMNGFLVVRRNRVDNRTVPCDNVL